ncbi:hypothetical protein SVAN01_09399 [Stagonosporopsis vannaccii]|nr:hypothetical protein SVAN01_09399 [Stagonosporopsis vannaccii]
MPGFNQLQPPLSAQSRRRARSPTRRSE